MPRLRSKDSPLERIRAMRHSVHHKANSFCFCPGLTEEQRQAAEKYAKEQHKLWAESWILPHLDALEKRFTPKSKEGKLF